MLTKWDKLPDSLRTPEVRPYYEILNKRRFSLLIKRLFDLLAAILLLVILALPMLIIAVWIKTDSDGPVFYRQERVTKDGKHFRIHNPLGFSLFCAMIILAIGLIVGVVFLAAPVDARRHIFLKIIKCDAHCQSLGLLLHRLPVPTEKRNPDCKVTAS